MGSSLSAEDINIRTVTVNAALFSLLSTTLAQCITSWSQQHLSFKGFSYITFALMAIITTPPNFMYQTWLENTFPTYIVDDKQSRKQAGSRERRKRLSKTNTLTKFLLDQSFGASANTLAFIVFNRLIQGYGLEQIAKDIKPEFYSLLFAGWRVWPLVTFLNLCLVPWEWRPTIGNAAGLCWGVYLTVINLEN